MKDGHLERGRSEFVRGSVFCRVKGCFSAVTEGYLGEEEKD